MIINIDTLRRVDLIFKSILATQTLPCSSIWEAPDVRNLDCIPLMSYLEILIQSSSRQNNSTRLHSCQPDSACSAAPQQPWNEVMTFVSNHDMGDPTSCQCWIRGNVPTRASSSSARNAVRKIFNSGPYANVCSRQISATDAIECQVKQMWPIDIQSSISTKFRVSGYAICRRHYSVESLITTLKADSLSSWGHSRFLPSSRLVVYSYFVNYWYFKPVVQSTRKTLIDPGPWNDGWTARQGETRGFACTRSASASVLWDSLHTRSTYRVQSLLPHEFVIFLLSLTPDTDKATVFGLQSIYTSKSKLWKYMSCSSNQMHGNAVANNNTEL